ncbi:broad specificity phosphatase PhoE [Cytobacillus horneckiae]
MHMTMICLIRHGETDWNAQNRIQGRTDIPLNGKGKQQAIQCGKYLALNDWDVIISSPLIRARQTAELINENTNLPITIIG